MSDRAADLPPKNLPVGSVDAAGMAINPEEGAPPEQAPLDEAAGGRDGERADIDEVSTDDLSVQGGA